MSEQKNIIHTDKGFSFELIDKVEEKSAVNRHDGILVNWFWLARADAHRAVDKRVVETYFEKEVKKSKDESKNEDTKVNHILRYDIYELKREIAHQRARIKK